MNGKLLAAAAFAAVSVGAAFAVEHLEADAPVVGEACLQSPDGRTKCSFALKDGHSRVAFSFDGKSVGETSFEPGLDAEYEIIGTSERVVCSSWTPIWGTQSVYPENYRELTVRLTCPKQNGRETLRIELRVYDEGVAMRYVVTPNVYSENAIERERYAVSFPAGSVAWPIPSTEATYPEEPMDVAGLDAGRSWRMPLTVRTSSGVYASILEANTVDWPRSYLVADGKGGFASRFAHGAKCGRGEWVSPWRAILLAPSAGGLIERSYLVQNLNAPCSIERTDWIRPGLSVSDFGNCEFKTDEVIAAAKAAKKVGAKYLQLDWGWYGTEYRWSDADREHFRKMTPKLADDPTWVENSYADPFTVAKGTVPYHPFWDFSSLTRFNVELDIRKIVGELRKLDMGLCLYVHGNVLENTDLDRLFATYESWGVAGLKPGFVAYGSQVATDWMRKLAETAAKHHLWLDIHDEHIPDGFERTWPNVMITEGGGGAEGGHPVHQDVALPFGRCLAGPFDYTPEFFNPKRTHAHAAAFLVCYPGPTAVMRGNLVKMMAEEPTYPEFIGALPWTYDETRVLAGEISKYLVVARRKGDTWYLGGMNGSSVRTVRVSAGFLKTATTFRFWTDSGEKTIAVGSNESIEIEMSVGGGFVGLSLPKKDGGVGGL